MNSSGRLLNARQVRGIYRRRARKAGRWQTTKGGRGGDALATRVSGVQKAQRRSRDSKLLGCRTAVRGGGVVRGTAALKSVDVGGGRWSLFVGRGGATRCPEIRRTWQREGRLEGGRPGSSSNNAQRWQCEGRACVAAAVMGVECVGVYAQAGRQTGRQTAACACACACR